MFKFFYISFFSFLLFPFFSDGIIISEIQIEGESVNECYIKLYNPLQRNIDVSGYNLRKKTSTGTDGSVRVFPAESIIKADGYFLWASSREGDFPSKVGADVSSTQYLSSNNSIALFDDNGLLIDAVAWGDGENQYFKGKPLENPKKGQIIKRVKDSGSYIRTGDNSLDFYTYPPLALPLKVDGERIDDKKEKKISGIFLLSLFPSLFFGLLIIYLKRKWQDTVTTKT